MRLRRRRSAARPAGSRRLDWFGRSFIFTARTCLSCGIGRSSSADPALRARSRNPKETPFPGDALEDMRSVVEKVEAEPRAEFFARARHEALARSRLRHHARARMDGDAGNLVVDALALSRV